MRYVRLGLDLVEIQTDLYHFLVSRGKPVAYRVVGEGQHVYRSKDLGGKDIKAYTRHLNIWAGGSDMVTYVPQRHINELFASIGRARNGNHVHAAETRAARDRREGERRGDLLEPGSHAWGQERRVSDRRSEGEGEE